MHLEGALTLSLLFTLAARNHISLPKDDPAFTSREILLARYKRFTSLNDFLHYYYIGMSVTLTVYPISNVTLGCVISISEVPVIKFLDAEIRFSISSDNPAYSGGHILDNYCAVQEAFDLGVVEGYLHGGD